MRRLRKADGGELDWSKLNQPTGSLTAHNPTPTEAIGNAAKDAMVGLGAQPYVANHVVGGVGNILGLTPLGIAGSAADTVAAQARGDKLGAIEGMTGMVPGVRAMPHVQAAQAVSRQMQKLTAAREMFGDLAEHIGMLHNKVNDIADSHVAPEMLETIDHLRSVKDHETDLHGITDTAKELMRAKVPKEIISDLPEDLAPHQRDDIAAIEQRLRRLYGMLPDRAAEVRKAGIMAEREMRRFNSALPEDMGTMDWVDSIVEPHYMLNDTKQRIGRHLPDAERASGGRIGYADGGAPTFNPDEFSTFKAAAPARSPGFDPDEFAASRQQQEPAGSWLDTAREAGKGLVRGVGNMVGDVGEALAGPFGPRKDFARLMHDTGLSKEEPQVEAPYGAQIAKNLGIDSAKPGYAGSIAESVGNPLSYIGPGGPIPKLLMAAGSGAGGEAGEDLARSSKVNPTVGRIAGSLIGGPLAARLTAPRVGADQRALLDAGMTEMTPGQLGGGWLKSIEDKMTSFPILGEFIQNARGQSVRGFNRAVGNQALEPIGEQLASGTAAGHDTITEVGRKLGAAYDELVPNLHFVPDYDFAQRIAELRTDARTMPRSTAQQFERILNDRLHPNRWGEQQLLPPDMPNPGNLPAVRSPSIWGLQGQQFKQVESELTNLAGRYTKSSDAGQQQLGDALNEVVRAMRANIQRVNPDYAAELARINTGWAMFARMRDAATRRATSEGVFTPNDLLNAVKRGDKSAGKGAFARGDALMQDFAEAGQRVLPSTVPDSGTTGRLLMAGALGGTSGHYLAQALHRPEILGGIGAAMGLYTRPSTWLLNHYANARPGGVRDALSEAGRGAGMAVPFINQPPPFAQGGIVARRVRTQASRPRTTPIAKAPSPFQQRVPNPFTT